MYSEEKVVTNRNAFVDKFCNAKKRLFYHVAVRQTSNTTLCATMIGFLCSLVKMKQILTLKYTAVSSDKLRAAENDSTSEHFSTEPFRSTKSAV